MPKRLILVTLPPGAELAGLGEGDRVLTVQADAEVGGRRSVQVLVEGADVEATLDGLEERWGRTEGFHAVLLAAEATLPRPNEETAPAVEPQTQPQPPSERISRDELFADVTEGLGLSPTFLALTLLSTVVAAAGLLRDDVAVIVGAMVVAPLLRPNVAMALGATLGDLELVARAARAILLGAACAFGLSALAGAAAAVDPATPALAARSTLGMGDFALALAAGAAGALAFTRGLASAVIGVMVAVALLPPVVASGLLAGAGFTSQAVLAMLLAVTNTICINLAAIATFLLSGIRPPGLFAAEKARRSTRVAIAIWIALLAVLVVLVAISATETAAMPQP